MKREELRALHAAATPGPWRSCWDDQEPSEDVCSPVAGIIIEAPNHPDPYKRFVLGTFYYDGIVHPGCTRENTALIVEAVNSLPEILSELDRKDATIRELWKDLGDEEDRIHALHARVREMEAQVAELKDVLVGTTLAAKELQR